MTKHSESMLPHLQHVFKLLKVDVTKEQLDKFAMFDDFLIEYNEKINLTRIVDPLEVAVKHFGGTAYSDNAVPWCQSDRCWCRRRISRHSIGDNAAGFEVYACRLLT